MEKNELHFESCPIDATPPELDTLVYEILYRDWQVAREPQECWYEREQGGQFITARDGNGALLGALRLMPLTVDDGLRRLQVRQVLVDARLRKGGIGRALMEQAEEMARAQGVQELWLNAREPAWGFYEALAYRYISGVWLSKLTKIPHRTMSKKL